MSVGPAVVIDLPDLEATRQLGRRLGELLFPGAVVALVGELGAGKTHLTRAVAEGLGVADSRVVTEINGPSIRGSRIEGGTSRRIAKGDVVIIPGGTPHWWSDLESDLAYLVVRPDPDDLLKTK